MPLCPCFLDFPDFSVGLECPQSLMERGLCFKAGDLVSGQFCCLLCGIGWVIHALWMKDSLYISWEFLLTGRQRHWGGGTRENEVLALGPWSTPGLLSLSQGHWKECYSFKIYSLASSKKRLGTGYIWKNSCKLTFLKMKWNRAPLKKVGSIDVLNTCFGAL